MASDAIWMSVVSHMGCKLQMRGKRLPGNCPLDVKDGEVFKMLKKIGEKGRAFRIANERGQLGHLQRELVASLWPVNASITWNRKGKGTTILEYTPRNNDSFVLFS